MELGKKIATRELRRLGFQVDEIRESSGKRADLRVSDREHVYHIEVKDKFDTDDIPTARSDALYRRKDPLTHNNTISGVLRNAHRQLNDTPKIDGTFQLIWFHAETDLQWQQAFATFYGNMPVSGLFPDRHKSTVCFYFTFNASYAMPDIEALILTEGDGLHLCLNEFSDRAAEFRCTRLFELLSHGAIDPIELESSGRIIAFRANVSRKNERAVLMALKEQTGVEYVANPLTRYSF